MVATIPRTDDVRRKLLAARAAMLTVAKQTLPGTMLYKSPFVQADDLAAYHELMPYEDDEYRDKDDDMFVRHYLPYYRQSELLRLPDAWLWDSPLLFTAEMLRQLAQHLGLKFILSSLKTDHRVGPGFEISVKEIDRPCGFPDCCVSSFISEQLTFGRGHLDHNGIFETECRICAAAAEARDRAEELHLKHPDWFPYLPTE